VPVVDGLAATAMRQAFDALHLERYGHHAPGEPVEIVNLRLRAEAEVQSAVSGQRSGAGASSRTAQAARSRQVVLERARGAVECPVYTRSDLGEGTEVPGPAVISEYGSVTLLYPGDVAYVGAEGHLVVKVG
jgi:N-methylhydantoinase A